MLAVGVISPGGGMQPTSKRLIRIRCKNFTGLLLYGIEFEGQVN
jgi:hypothetical protein